MPLAYAGAIDPRAYRQDISEALDGATTSVSSDEIVATWPRFIHALALAGALSYSAETFAQPKPSSSR